jgi:hypothetical protein
MTMTLDDQRNPTHHDNKANHDPMVSIKRGIKGKSADAKQKQHSL